mmetsp:Transcript_13404/g.36058  ORF Transcript_13404/g.36058 Transcript_13404/m.36058 type:complete len:592 (+) Transcript_13404:89-1864(+)
MAATTMDGTRDVFYEIFDETSNGDFGIEPTDGPLIRAHTHILTKVPGFIGKVRHFGTALPRTVEDDGPQTSKDYFKKHGLIQMSKDAKFVQFSQPIGHSVLKKSNAFGEEPIDVMMPGYSTRTLIAGDRGAFRRADQFFLSERYQIDVDVERLCELLRFIYQGYTAYFDIKPKTDTERAVLTQKMLAICQDSERFSVDGLFVKLLTWFGSEAYGVVGDKNFANAFYHLEYALMQCTEEHSRTALRETITGDMLRSRSQFRAVTLDPRWKFLPVQFVETTLSKDTMPIASETEVLNLIERWNANADKPKSQIVQLLACFRPDEETIGTLRNWLTGLGWLNADGTFAEMPEKNALRDILGGKKHKLKKPRQNLVGTQLIEAQLDAEIADAPESNEAETTFEHWMGGQMLAKGCAFSLGAKQRLIQADPIRTSGVQRLRVVLSNPRRDLWDPSHEVFVGISYGEGRWFGYLCSATAFSGIFSVRAWASAAPIPNAPVHITGSGNKVEFDMALEVQLMRVNLVVTCKLSIIFANETVTEELFQIAHETLKVGKGLRYQVVAANLKDEEVDVSLTCVSGGGSDEQGTSVGIDGGVG